ncbi:MAG: phosphate signaling complex protein PhoU [Phycisphaerales bacterium]|nr:phosphate signaling complex protein PhoU [Phycisphaerae bacterium]NNF41899.1 phosphate signaling complex protein PhoU [Phycisphaerales bacterium]NNM27404.1 phosphate signaling complex protein PhoU [Phycisphaerales bacterium]
MAINLENELTELRRMVLSMGAIVEQRLSVVVDAIVNHDYPQAQRVRHGDRDVDQMDLDIEAACLRVLALSQPVASDLRFLLAVLRINSDLERIGDLAKSIAKRVLDLSQSPEYGLPPSLSEMADRTREMLAETMAAFAEEDAESCRRIHRSDHQLDDIQKEIFQWATAEIPRHVESTEGVINTLSIARALERIGDLATNIAEDVIFLVEGSIVRHRVV